MDVLDEITEMLERAQKRYDDALNEYECRKRNWFECPGNYSKQQMRNAKDALQTAYELLEAAQEEAAERYVTLEEEEED